MGYSITAIVVTLIGFLVSASMLSSQGSELSGLEDAYRGMLVYVLSSGLALVLGGVGILDKKHRFVGIVALLLPFALPVAVQTYRSLFVATIL